MVLLMFFEALYFGHFLSFYTMQLEPPKGGSVSMGMMRYFYANICSASFSSLSTHHLIGVLISSLEQRAALRRLGGQVCIVFVLT